MTDIRTSGFGGIPYGNDAGRPLNPGIGRLYSNGESQRLELYTSTGWRNIIQETPSISNVSGQLNETSSSTIIISGTNFAEGVIASVIGSNGTEVSASSVTYISSTGISATFPALSPAYEPYDVKIVNPSNLFSIIYDTLSVNDAPVWSTSSGSIGSFTEFETVSVSVSATDALDPTNSSLSYSLVSGTLPPGLSLSSNGLISGTLSTNVIFSTTYIFSLSATDGRNTSSTRQFSITVNDRSPVWSTSTTLAIFTKNSPYSVTVAATEDDMGEITYSLVSGTLPTGLSLSSNGVISGTPTSSLSSTVTIRATVTASGTTSDRTFTLPNSSPSWVTSGAISSTNVGSNYSYQLVASDDSGVAPTYALVSGTLPTGLTISSSGLISGTPQSSGTFSFVASATDQNGGSTNSATLSLNVTNIVVSGGTLTTDGTYLYRTFTSSGTLSVSGGTINATYIMGGGGAGGASGNSGSYGGGGGGGAGGFRAPNSAVLTGSYNVVIGAGGSGGPNGTNGTPGSTTSFNGISAGGGGNGGQGGGTSGTSGSAGGGGSGGGGGASGAGTNGNAGANGGAAYSGLTSWTSTTGIGVDGAFCGGGGGAFTNSSAAGSTTGGGGNSSGGAASANSGSGGAGGGNAPYTGGNGASGFVIVRYQF